MLRGFMIRTILELPEEGDEKAEEVQIDEFKYIYELYLGDQSELELGAKNEKKTNLRFLPPTIRQEIASEAKVIYDRIFMGDEKK